MWMAEDKPVDTMTLSDLEKQCAEIAAQRLLCEQAAGAKKVEDEKLATLEGKMMETLTALGRDSFQSKVGTFYKTHKMSFRLPKDPSDKEAYFKYLQNQGVYDAMVTVNSMTHNSYCKQQFEIAQAEGKGLDFKIPGVGEPTILENLSFRKSK